ncbi:hypothetical protein ATE84_1819 [Aquimarina sp. MAR_2010_214]|uniref:hypothetical protein n=1 Tax=Aquimarina sp. MAR_2010_214 TaxID=1250026 RepID=UPI000CC744E7|nr:hypothetical protein [Aquimarina sp. MAR_2010_214]PKV49782.1 hypothetical protein ATE84_1819 [Aquimarina sp. MAR_2010_214]
MKKLPLIAFSFILSTGMFAQIGTGDAGALIGLPTATDLAEINAIIGPSIGSVVFNLNDQEIYRFTSTGWQRSTDDQLDSEVNLTTPIDVDESGETTPTLETNVQQVIQAIAPITSGAARVFYPPSIEVPVATNGTFTLNLYNQYTAQFSSPTATSPAAPDIPVYAANELHYYVTFADPAVFNTGTMSIDANGVLTYTVIGQPLDFNSLINVVFVVK